MTTIFPAIWYMFLQLFTVPDIKSSAAERAKFSYMRISIGEQSIQIADPSVMGGIFTFDQQKVDHILKSHIIVSYPQWRYLFPIMMHVKHIDGKLVLFLKLGDIIQ